jgi:hypothetical protein
VEDETHLHTRHQNDNLEATVQSIYDDIFSNCVDQSISKKLSEIIDTIDNRGKTPPNDT